MTMRHSSPAEATQEADPVSSEIIESTTKTEGQTLKLVSRDPHRLTQMVL